VKASVRPSAARGRRLSVVIALVLALVLAASALAAGGRYKGKVKSGGALSFRTTATSVVGFKASVSPVCTSVAGSMVKIYLIRGLPKGSLKNGHFTIKYHVPAFSTYVTVTGKVGSSSASGRINVHYTLLNGTVIYACQFKGPWSATKA
jgi:hypothetical protein